MQLTIIKDLGLFKPFCVEISQFLLLYKDQNVQAAGRARKKKNTSEYTKLCVTKTTFQLEKQKSKKNGRRQSN